MKNIYSLFTLLVATFVFGQATGVGIGTLSPHTSAQLEVSSTNKAFLPPRMSKAQIDLVGKPGSPAQGLIIYCDADDCAPRGLYHYNGTVWAPVYPPYSFVDIDNTSIGAVSGFTGVFAPGKQHDLATLGSFYSDQTKRATFVIRLSSPSGFSVSFSPKMTDLDIAATGLSVRDIDYKKHDGSREEGSIPFGEPGAVTITGGASGYTDIYYELEGTLIEGFSGDIPFSINQPAVQVSFSAKLDVPTIAEMFSYKTLYQSCSLTSPSTNASLYENYESNGANSVATVDNTTIGGITSGGGATGATAFIAANEKAVTGNYKVAREITAGGGCQFDFVDFGAVETHLIRTDITTIYAVAIGGGGGGGASSNSGVDQGAGGAGGGGAAGTFTVVPNTNLSITVGYGGVGGAQFSNMDGVTGGNSRLSYGASFIEAYGGYGGEGDSGSPDNNGGLGRSGTYSGVLNPDTTTGFSGTSASGTGIGGNGGAATPAIFPYNGILSFSGGGSSNDDTDGNPGNIAGGGGTGGEDLFVVGGRTYPGGKGARGQVRILYKCPTAN